VSEKTFTIDEANTMLPVLDSLLKRAMDAKQMMEDVDAEFEDITHKVFLNGGTLLDIGYLARRKAEREKAIQSLKDTVEEIHSTGVQVKDLDIGLLDFPCLVEGETVLLCWKYGEPHAIEHWHGMEEGFAGRKPIEQLRLKRKKKPEQPN
jgi:hypothetical protein